MLQSPSKTSALAKLSEIESDALKTPTDILKERARESADLCFKIYDDNDRMGPLTTGYVAVVLKALVQRIEELEKNE